MKKARKRLISMLLVCVMMMQATVFAAEITEEKREESASDLCDILRVSEINVAEVDLSEIQLSERQQRQVDSFNNGLASALKREFKDYESTPDELQDGAVQERIDAVLSDYCETHYDPLSGIVNDEVLKRTKSREVLMSFDSDEKAYQEYVKHYSINDTMDLTIAPDCIYIDQFAEERVSSEENEADGEDDDIPDKDGASIRWKYKNVAAQRTFAYKVTVKNKTYACKIYSTHVGGRVKYNGKRARHSSNKYAYSQRETYGELATFKKISNLSEKYDAKGWHYKYWGKVSGSVTVLDNTFRLPEKVLGCQIIVKKNGSVTKKYWPDL